MGKLKLQAEVKREINITVLLDWFSELWHSGGVYLVFVLLPFQSEMSLDMSFQKLNEMNGN